MTTRYLLNIRQCNESSFCVTSVLHSQFSILLILSISPVDSISFDGALPADPFVSQTALARALVAEGRSTLRGLAGDRDTLVMIAAMRKLGCRVESEGELTTIIPPPEGLTMPAEAIGLGTAAYPFRLLTGILAAAGVKGRLEADVPLSRRNIERLLDPLRALGAEITSSDRGTPPVYIFPGDFIDGRTIELPIANAYLKSALVAAARTAGVSLAVIEPRPSRDHAERIFQGAISSGPPYRVDLPSGRPEAIDWRLPSDTLLADHLTTLAILRDRSSVAIERRLATALETRVLDLLVSAGALVECVDEPQALEPTGSLRPHGSTLAGELLLEGESLAGLEHEVPLLAVALGAGGGRIEVRGAMNLRQQICDRIAALVDNLGAVGIETEEFDDGFRAHGSGVVRGGCDISAYDDPVIALAMILLLALADAPSTLHDVPDDYRCRAMIALLGEHVALLE
jgi:3-phosphoshikimate 1-carboxyvinyltransferase